MLYLIHTHNTLISAAYFSTVQIFIVRCSAFERVCNFSYLTVLLYDNGDKCRVLYNDSHQLFLTSGSEISFFNFHTLLQLTSWIIQDSNWSNIIFTPVEMIANTFELFQLGIKESWKASLLPSVPLHGEWNQSLNIKLQMVPVEPMQWWRGGRGSSFTLYSLSFLSFFNPQKCLLSVTSKVKRGTEKKIFSYFLFLKEHVPCEL